MKKILILVITFFLASVVYAGDLVVANSSTGELSKANLKKMYLGKMKSWPDGSKVVLTVLKSGDDHKAFLKGKVGKSESQFKSYWKKKVFTGKGVMPKNFASDTDLLSFIASNPGAIGYVSEGSLGALPAGIKKITLK